MLRYARVWIARGMVPVKELKERSITLIMAEDDKKEGI